MKDKYVKTYENYKKMSEINSINDGKIIIPLYIYDLDTKLQKSVKDFSKKIKGYVSEPFYWISVRDINRLYNHPKFKYISSWEDIMGLLYNYIEKKMELENGIDHYCQPAINKYINEFFRYMPFIKIEAEGMEFSDLDLGYCCEDCDGDRNNYIESHFEVDLSNFIDRITKKYNIKINFK